jgi:hypothetical protein
MTLLVHEPAARTTTSAAAPPGQQRRGARRAVLTLLMIGLAWAALPLAVDLDDAVVPQLPVDAGLLVPEYGDRGAHLLHYRHGETVTVEVPVSNRGPLPISIDEVSLPGQQHPLLEPVAASGLPLELGAFDSGSVRLTLRYGNCRYYHERSAAVVDELVVAGSVLGRRLTETVGLGRPLVVHGQVILDCPDRTLVRGDDVRR